MFDGVRRRCRCETHARMRTRALHVVGLYALAVAQPLLAVLGANAEFFASRRAGGGEVIAFALLVVLVPPLLAVGLDALTRGRLHLALIALLVGLIAAQLFKRAGDWGTAPMIAAAVAAGAGAAVAYARSAGLRSFATWLAPAPIVVLVLFLAVSPAREIAFAPDVAAAAIHTTSTTPVVMLVLDEVSMTTFLDADRRVDAKAYPNLARLARRATTYRTFTAAGDETTKVISALLTGNPWRSRKGALPIASDYPRNLFTLLGGSFEMHVSEEASDLCPPRVCAPSAAGGSERASLGSLLHDAAVVYGHVVAPPGIERRLTPTDQTLGRFDDEPTTEGNVGRRAVLSALGEGGRPRRFAAWLRSIRPTERPALYFKHVLLPHLPWQYLPDGRAYPPPSGDIRGADGELSFGDPWLVRQAYQRHLLQARYTDRLIGRLLDRLEQQGLYDRALVVLTADNGEAFGKLGHSRHETDDATAAGIASTPLFVKLPGQRRGRYSDLHVRTVDVVPTIADALGIRPPWPMAGRSFLRPGYVPAPDVAVDGHPDGHESKVTLTLPEYRRRAAAELAAKERVFGEDVYAVGPHRELLGRRVTPGADPPAGLHAGLIAPDRLDAIDLTAPVLPAAISGRLTGSGVRAGLPLALTLDGRVVATGLSARVKDDPRTYFSFMVPPAAFHRGRNVAGVYLVTARGLAPLGP
jgi:hypothetical protein